MTHKLVELAELVRDETHDKLASIADKRIAEAVEEFKKRFPKRKLHMGPINGWVVVLIDDRLLHWDDARMPLDGPKDNLRLNVEAPFFQFITDALNDAEEMFGHWESAYFADVTVEPNRG
jgi:hypothetical protein